jgi:hypothetical protein
MPVGEQTHGPRSHTWSGQPESLLHAPNKQTPQPIIPGG